MNSVSAAIEQASKLNNEFTKSAKFVGQVDRLNKRFDMLKGVDSMDKSIRKMSVEPTLPTLNSAIAIQRGNSTHESLFGVAFFMQLHRSRTCEQSTADLFQSL